MTGAVAGALELRDLDIVVRCYARDQPLTVVFCLLVLKIVLTVDNPFMYMTASQKTKCHH